MEAVLTREVILLTTKLGEAFHGNIMPKKVTFSKTVRNQNPDNMIFTKDKTKHDGSKSFNQFINKDECVVVKLKRLPNVHRAVDICCDNKGNNFAVLQVNIYQYLSSDFSKFYLLCIYVFIIYVMSI